MPSGSNEGACQGNRVLKIIFAGPSLPDAASLAGEGICVLPPATQGDVFAAVEQGANVIGLIDGGFEYAAPVWHKEILHALSLGVAVLGAASMGALRAAECHPFGMIGIGRIFEDYRIGRLVDDAAVALTHAPSALGSKALTVPLVNVSATLDVMEDRGLLESRLRQQLKMPQARYSSRSERGGRSSSNVQGCPSRIVRDCWRHFCRMQSTRNVSMP